MSVDETRKGLITIAEFSVEEVIKKLPKPGSKNVDRKFKVGGKTYLVKMNSSRYYTFRDNLSCVCCGLKGVKFKLQRHPVQPKQPEHRAHFNLFGVERDGTEVMLTKDHIKPKSLGGPNSLNNYQTMCMVCNGLKRNQVIPMEFLLKLKREWVANRKKNNNGRIRKKEKSPVIGYVLWRLDTTASKKKLKQTRFGVFLNGKELATDKILKAIKKSRIEYYCSEQNQSTGIWPVFKMQSIRSRNPGLKLWDDCDKRKKNEKLGYEVMGWDQFLMPTDRGRIYWNRPDRDPFPVSEWRPTSRRKDLERLEKRLSRLKLKRKYNKLVREMRRPSLEDKCDVAWAVVNSEFGIE